MASACERSGLRCMAVHGPGLRDPGDLGPGRESAVADAVEHGVVPGIAVESSGHRRGRSHRVHHLLRRQASAGAGWIRRHARRGARAGTNRERPADEGQRRGRQRAAVFAYFPLALGIVAVGSLIAATTASDMYVLGYVLYGLFAIFVVIVPDVLAFWFARDVPFPTLARTVADLERRWSPATMVIVAGLVVLMCHLAFPQWPDAIG